MKAIRWLTLPVLTALLIGCNAAPDATKGPPAKGEPTSDVEGKIKATLARLNDDDRDSAETQKFCAVQTDSRLGSMGVPPKIMLKDKEGAEHAVFLCCKGCEEKARKDEAKTLARVEEMVIHNTLAKLSPEDRKLAEAQRVCATMEDSRLGSMGVPPKIMLTGKDGKEHPVFLCCGGCAKNAKKDVEKTLTFVEDMKKKTAQLNGKDKKE